MSASHAFAASSNTERSRWALVAAPIAAQLGAQCPALASALQTMRTMPHLADFATRKTAGIVPGSVLPGHHIARQKLFAVAALDCAELIATATMRRRVFETARRLIAGGRALTGEERARFELLLEGEPHERAAGWALSAAIAQHALLNREEFAALGEAETRRPEWAGFPGAADAAIALNYAVAAARSDNMRLSLRARMTRLIEEAIACPGRAK